jgi:uncharacterized protein (TIGR03067 family)
MQANESTPRQVGGNETGAHFFEMSRSWQPARQVNAVARRRNRSALFGGYMRICLLLTFAIGVSVTPAPAQNKGAKSDLEKLEGTWKVTSYEDGDDKAAEEDLKGWSYTFKGNKVTVSIDGKTDRADTFKLNEGKKPREIDITVENLKGTGIYELDGERLTVRIYFDGTARPKAIKGPLNKSEQRLELKRQKS